jgi:hypothetical protein
MREYPDPGELPPNATPEQRRKHHAATERFMTEGFDKNATKVPATIDPTDQRLQELRRRAGAFMELHSPMKASIWLALTRPVADLLSDVEQTRRFAAAQRAGGKGKASLEFKAPRHSAAVEIGQRLVAAAIEGDMTALSVIADRIEGKPGLRRGDEDPTDAEQRRKTQALQNRIVELMTARTIEAKAEKAQVIDVEVTEVPDEIEVSS